METVTTAKLAERGVPQGIHQLRASKGKWFNVYQDDLCDGPYETKDDADANAGYDRKSCEIL